MNPNNQPQPATTPAAPSTEPAPSRPIIIGAPTTQSIEPALGPQPIPVVDTVVAPTPPPPSWQKPEPQLAPERTTKPLRRPGRSRHGKFRDFLSTIVVIFSAVALAIVLTLYVFQPYQVDGISMQPTLHDADRLIIWKVPRTISRITGNPYIPNRGDVVVFSEPSLTDISGRDRQLIKRVIAVPGDHLVIKNGNVTVFNEQHPLGFQPDLTLPYGDSINLTVDPQQSVDLTISEGQIFAMGDNRYNSMDSRLFGPVDADKIIGKLALRVLPISDFKLF